MLVMVEADGGGSSTGCELYKPRQNNATNKIKLLRRCVRCSMTLLFPFFWFVHVVFCLLSSDVCPYRPFYLRML